MRSKYSQLFARSIAALATVFSTACSGVQSALDPAGPQARNISKLWWLMFFVCTSVFLAVTIVLTLAISRSRTRSGAEDLTPELQMPPEAEQRRRNIVAAATAFTVVTLFVFLVASFLVGRGMSAELSAKQGVAVEVTGHQWWWEVRYLNDDASSIFTTANEIHIPVGTPVTVTLKASDVIHSFWVPNLHGKADAIPGKVATMWFQADRPGTYRGQCAEYCGLQHAHMGLIVIAESREQFNSWLTSQTQPAIQPSSATAARGQQIFMSGTCNMCHAISGTEAGSNIGPNLTHVASRQTIGAATMTNLGDHLSQWIADSQKIKPGNRMPPHNLSPEDLQAVIDYMQTLK